MSSDENQAPRASDQKIRLYEGIGPELHARCESFLRVADPVKIQLGGIMEFLFISSQGETSNDNVPPEKISSLWHEMGRSDPEIFCRQILEMSFLHGQR